LVDGVRYYVIPEPGRFARNGNYRLRLDDELSLLFGLDHDRRAVSEAVAVVEEYQPHLVHVFGAENRHGLMAPLIESPVVVWIQGTLDVYRRHFFGSMGCGERLRQPRLLWNFYRMVVDAARERKIYAGCRYFIGRTGWDAAHQARLQPQGQYYAVQECLRPEFHAALPWRREDALGFNVYTTTSGSLLKGTDVLVHAIALLRARYPDIRLRVAGLLEERNPVARRLFRLVEALGLSQNVAFLGQLDSVQIVTELKQARVFVLPSFIENSPNSLAEAQLVGTPAVAAFVGGVQEMVTDGQTGLLFQAGDSSTSARQIARVLEDDDLAARLSHQSRRVAQERHSRSRIVEALLKAYDEVLKSNGSLQT
jgi:glycosyltransferase involved in cell wall biosynthesis